MEALEFEVARKRVRDRGSVWRIVSIFLFKGLSPLRRQWTVVVVWIFFGEESEG